MDQESGFLTNVHKTVLMDTEVLDVMKNVNTNVEDVIKGLILVLNALMGITLILLIIALLNVSPDVKHVRPVMNVTFVSQACMDHSATYLALSVVKINNATGLMENVPMDV